MTFSEYAIDWLALKKADLERSTYEAYEIYVMRHLVPYFDTLGKPIDQITPRDVKGYVLTKLNGGRLDGKSGGLSPVSVRKHLHLIKQIYADAVMDLVVPYSPAASVRLPRCSASEPCGYFLSVTEAQAIIDAFHGHPLYELVFLTLYYGLRKSEALGLSWSAIDFKNESISIRATVVKNRSIVYKERTKTESSRRTYPLLPEVKTVLLDLLRKQEEAKIASLVDGVPYRQNDFVFKWDFSGIPYRPDFVLRSFQRVLRKNRLPVIRFHDLRHGTASILFDRGWTLKDVQVWLGHSDIQTTANIYTHYRQERKIEVASDISRLFVNKK